MSKAACKTYTEWLTLAEVSELTGVSTDLLARGADAGLFQGLTATLDGERRFAPDTLQFVAWTDRLYDDVAAGAVTEAEAHRLLWSRALQMRRRVTTKPRPARRKTKPASDESVVLPFAFDINQAAKALGVTPQEVADLIDTGSLRAITVNGRPLVATAELARFALQGSEPAAEPANL